MLTGSSAPTGAGKTVLFELGIIRVLQNDSKGRIVYMAPTKSLCNERYEDWKAKFAHLGVTCASSISSCLGLTGDRRVGTQVTGDSNSASAFAELKRSHVMCALFSVSIAADPDDLVQRHDAGEVGQHDKTMVRWLFSTMNVAHCSSHRRDHDKLLGQLRLFWSAECCAS